MQKSILKRVRWKKVLLLFVCGYMVFCLIGGCFDIYKLKVQEKELEAKIEAADEENALWQKKVDEMSSESAIERIARERLGLVMPGEVSLKKIETSTDDAQ